MNSTAHQRQTIEMVTLMPRLPLSANSWAILVSNTRQSEFIIAEETPSWIDLGVASHVKRLLWPFSSNLMCKKLIFIILYQQFSRLFWLVKLLPWNHFIPINIPYILKSNLHPFYSFRGLKNQMWIRIACGLDWQSRAGFWKNDKSRCTCRKSNTIIYYFIYL